MCFFSSSNILRISSVAWRLCVQHTIADIFLFPSLSLTLSLPHSLFLVLAIFLHYILDRCTFSPSTHQKKKEHKRGESLAQPPPPPPTSLRGMWGKSAREKPLRRKSIKVIEATFSHTGSSVYIFHFLHTFLAPCRRPPQQPSSSSRVCASRSFSLSLGKISTLSNFVSGPSRPSDESYDFRRQQFSSLKFQIINIFIVFVLTMRKRIRARLYALYGKYQKYLSDETRKEKFVVVIRNFFVLTLSEGLMENLNYAKMNFCAKTFHSSHERELSKHHKLLSRSTRECIFHHSSSGKMKRNKKVRGKFSTFINHLKQCLVHT